MFKQCDNTIHTLLHGEVLERLCDFIKLPSKSPDFDPDWKAHGFLDAACNQAAAWGRSFIEDAAFEVLTSPDHTPVLFFDIPATSKEIKQSALIYGHLDKQPEAQGWTNNRSPFVPSLEGNKLYGRGAADDGYSFYSAMAAVRALKDAGIAHGRITGLIETSEESGSRDMGYWMKEIAPRCGNVGLIVVLDSTCSDYERMWLTTSFRGCINLTLNVKVLERSVHSGSASSIVPDSFRIARSLLSRVEDEKTGEINDPRLNCPIEPERLKQIRATAEIIGANVFSEFPWYKSAHACQTDVFEAMATRGFKPALCVIGADGLPPCSTAGRVMRQETSLALSMRTPPKLDAKDALDALTEILTANPPYGADVTVTNTSAGDGWMAKMGCEWFDKAIDTSSREVFGCAPAYNCDGASISTLKRMQSHFESAQMLVTGVLGPQSNAHGPDEMLRLDYLEKLTCVIARVLSRME